MLLILSGIFGASGVALGAFGAHGLEGKLEPRRMKAFEAAVRYQLTHAVVLLAIGLHAGSFPAGFLAWSGTFFALGTVFFSGSIYILVFSGVGRWGAVTPVGGLFLILGWIIFLTGACFYGFRG